MKSMIGLPVGLRPSHVFDFRPTATAAYLAKGPEMTSDTQELPNRANSSADKLIRGSTTGVDTNDPLFLDHDGEHYIYLPGTSDNTITVSSPVGSGAPGAGVAARFRWALEDSGAVRLAAIGSDVVLGLNGSRLMDCNFRDSTGNFGNSNTPIRTTAALPEAIYGATYDFGYDIVDANTVDFYYRLAEGNPLGVAATGSWEGWTLLERGTGTGRTFNTAWQANSLDLSSNNNMFVKGKFYGASIDPVSPSGEIRVVPSEDIDTSSDADEGQTQSTTSTGHTMDVSRATTGLATTVVTRPTIVFDGVDDFLQPPASDTPTFTPTTGKYTVAVLARFHEAPAATSMLWSSRPDSSNGGFLAVLPSGVVRARAMGGGVTPQSNLDGGLVVGEMQLFAYVANEGTVAAYASGVGLDAPTDITGIPSMSHGTPRVGCDGYVTSFEANCEVFAVLVFKDVALTETELDALANRFKTGTYA